MPPKPKIDLSANNYKKIGSSFTVPSIHYSLENELKIDVPFNMSIIGRTGSHKTNWLLNLVKYIDCFTKIELWVKVPDEPLYKYLTEMMQKVEKKLGTEIIQVHSNIDELPDIESHKDDYDNKEITLIIFDDLINEKSKKLEKVGAYFTHGRKYNISNIFISQSYFKIPMIIRQNIQYLVIQKINSKRDLKRILTENSISIEEDKLIQYYQTAQHNNKAFVIDLKTNDPNYQFRIDHLPISKFISNL